MDLLIVLNRPPYDGTDVTWNALRLAAESLKAGLSVRLFLMNDSVDLAREGLPPGADYDLQVMARELVASGAQARLCKTCVTRCGIGEGATIREIEVATMHDLVEWVSTSDRCISF